MNNIGLIYMLQDNYPLALENYQKSMKISEENGNNEEISICLDNIGGILQKQGNYHQALEYHERAMKINEKIGNKLGICTSYVNIGEVHLLIKNYSQALNYTLKSFKIANELKLSNSLKNIYELLSKIYVETNNYKKAFESHVLYKELNDSIFSEKNIKKITSLEYQYKFDKEKQAIELLQQKKDAVLVEEAKWQKTVRNAFIAGFILMFILAIVVLGSFLQKRKANFILADQKRKMEETNEKLKELDGFKQGMTGMIVHDLKNPLNLILNISPSFILKKQVEMMKNSGRQMLNMVMNILDVQRFEEVKMILETREHSLFEIVKSAMHQIDFLSQRKSITINNLIPLELIVKIDPEIIERVFVNLLTNAIKYTSNNGEIVIRTIEVLNSGFINIEVSDSGEGIPADKLDRVFDKFGQIKAKSSGMVRSTGLGLAFCKLAVEAHGGQIRVESEIGKGTSLFFTLPGRKDSKITPTSKTDPSKKKRKPELAFSEIEKTALAPCIPGLKSLMVYETSDIKYILDQIEVGDNINIQKWKDEVCNTLYATNEERYAELLRLIK